MTTITTETRLISKCLLLFRFNSKNNLILFVIGLYNANTHKRKIEKETRLKQIGAFRYLTPHLHNYQIFIHFIYGTTEISTL